MATCIVVWMLAGDAAKPSSVIGPYEDADLAAEDANTLSARGVTRVELVQITHPAHAKALL